MPKKLTESVEELDTRPKMSAPVGQLHTVTYRNFLVEHGRMTGEGKTIIHFVRVRAEPGRFMELLHRFFNGRVPPKISNDSQVILGGYQELGVQDAYSMVWETPLSDGMLGWIKRRVEELDRALD